MTDGTDFLDMDDEELGRMVRQTAAFRLAVACARFADGADEIQQSDELAWDRLMKETLDNQSRVSSKRSVESVVNAFLGAIEKYAALARHPEDAAERAASELAEREGGE